MQIWRIAWIGILLAAAAIFALEQSAWIRRALYVTSLANGPDLHLVRGHAGEHPSASWTEPALIIPEHNENSFQWLLQSKKLAANRAMVLANVDYDNAPLGRRVRSPSPYRWWLNAIALCSKNFEHPTFDARFDIAGLYADPLLGICGICAAVALAYCGLGPWSAAIVALGCVSFFPFGAAFLPAAPDSRGLVALLVLASLLSILSGLKRGDAVLPTGAVQPGSGSRRRWFIAAGVIGGTLCWISMETGIVIVGAILTGVFVSRFFRDPSRSIDSESLTLWRMWGVAGAVTIIVAYLVDYLPRGAGMSGLDQVHPLYALGWCGAVELCLVIDLNRFPSGSRSHIVRLSLAATPLVLISWLRLKGMAAFPEKDLLWPTLATIPGGAIAPNFKAWLVGDGFTLTTWATLLPLVLIPLAMMEGFARGVTSTNKTALVVMLIGTGAALVFAWFQLGWWSNLDAVLLATGAFAMRDKALIPLVPRTGIVTVILISGALGFSQLRLRTPVGPEMPITSAEAAQLVERDLARWLADRFVEKGVTVFAPPRETTALCYYGGFRGIGTFAVENQAGFGTALSIVGANTMEEVETIVRTRDIRCLVLPSWDPFLDDFARLYLSAQFSNRRSLLVRELRNWTLPLWLRPMAYQTPAIVGFEHHSVLVFEVVPEQTPAIAASRLAECLAELGNADRARAVADSLRRYPGDVGALAARANVQFTVGDSAAAAETVNSLKVRLAIHADRFLAWDRRVSLSVALAQAGELEQAREQVRRCLAEVDQAKLRALSTGTLFRLLVLTKTFEFDFADPSLRELANQLLPSDVRAQL